METPLLFLLVLGSETLFSSAAETAVESHRETGKGNIPYGQKFLEMDSSSGSMDQHTLIDFCNTALLHTPPYLESLHQASQIQLIKIKENKREFCAPKISQELGVGQGLEEPGWICPRTQRWEGFNWAWGDLQHCCCCWLRAGAGAVPSPLSFASAGICWFWSQKSTAKPLFHTELSRSLA